jgi:hypothetical protein
MAGPFLAAERCAGGKGEPLVGRAALVVFMSRLDLPVNPTTVGKGGGDDATKHQRADEGARPARATHRAGGEPSGVSGRRRRLRRGLAPDAHGCRRGRCRAGKASATARPFS